MPSSEVSCLINSFVRAFFLDEAARPCEQKASAVLVIVEPKYSTDRDEIAFSASVFGLTGESKRNLINMLKKVLLAGGSSERALDLRILAAEGGRHRSLPGLR